MKPTKKIYQMSWILLLPLLTGCAAGSATAAYAMRAGEADCLTAKGEKKITERVKREIMYEMNGRPEFTCEQ